MFARLNALLLAVFCVLPFAEAAAPPAQLTPAQQKRMQGAENAFREANALYKQGKLAETIAALRRGLVIEREVHGRVRLSSLGWLEGLANVQERAEAWAGAMRTRTEVMDVLQRAYGKDHWKVIDARLALADCQLQARRTAEQRKQLEQARQSQLQVERLYQEGKARSAVALARQVLVICKDILGEKHPNYARSLNTLAMLYQAMGDYKSALPLYKQAIAVRKDALGEKHPDYGTSLNNLAALYQARGDYKSALPLYKQTLSVKKDALGEKHPDYALSVNNLGLLYKVMGDYQSALPLYKQALAITKDALGEKHPNYALTLHNLALLYKETGDYQSALPLSKRALAVRKDVLGEQHPVYAHSLNNLAVLYEDMGDYKSALPLYKQALAITKDTLGEKHTDYAIRLNNLAGLYRDMGDYQSALPLFKQALAIKKGALGERHPEYALTLHNMAGLYQVTGDHQSALPLYQQALAIYKDILGEKHFYYGRSLNDLAGLYQAMEDYKSALPLFKQALAISKDALGEKHPDYAISLNNLALLSEEMGDYKSALPLFKQALAITKDALGEKHSRYATGLYGLAALYQKISEPKEARRFAEESLAAAWDNLVMTASIQSERQQLAAAQRVRYHLDFRLSLPDPMKQGPVASYHHVLMWKGAVFLQQQQRRRFARLAAGDAKVRDLVLRLQETTRLLAALTLAPVDPRAFNSRREQAEKRTREKEELESRLAALSDEFRKQRKQAETTLADMQKALPTDAALVDFLIYDHYDPTQTDRRKRWQKRVAAWVVRRDRPLVRIDLKAASPIEEAIAAWRETLVRPQRDNSAQGQAVRELVWAPLVKHLEGAMTVLLSPDGALARLPFAALPGTKKGSYLIEEAALAVVGVPQLLPQLLAPQKQPEDSLLVVGDVDYDKAQAAAQLAGLTRNVERGGMNWTALPATAEEGKAIRATFGGLFVKGNVTELNGDRASKAAVRAAMVKSRFVHLATHGFFAPPHIKSALAGKDRPGEMFDREGVTGWHPLLLSGVVLAGANCEPKQGEEDGVLTALEVSEMDLSGCDLAVLSACETGLGRVAGGEGLLGLQRALQVAGARSSVASLWKVDDRATKELMVSFYKRLWDKTHPVSRIEALRQAQLALLREGRKRGVVPGEDGSAPPFYWAAFVLSGDWR